MRSVALSALAIVAIGHALWLSDGHYDTASLYWIAAAILLAWSAVWSRGAAWIALPICVGGLLWQIVENLHQDPLGDVPGSFSYYTLTVPLLAVSATGAVLLPRPSRVVFVPLLLITYFVGGVALLSQSRKPFIDVYAITQASCDALSHGQNPYAITVPDIYQSVGGWEHAFYRPGAVVNGRIQFGYQYMPLSLYIASAGHILGGDFRYGNLLAVTIAGGLLAYARPGWTAAAGAALLLLTPKGYFVIDRGWSEPVILLFLAAVIFCACRRPGWLPWTVGLLLASKQDMIMAAPLALLLLPRPWRWKTIWPFYWKAAMTAMAVSLPMILWNAHAFWHSAVDELLRNPFREDSLNFAAAWVLSGYTPPPTWIALVLFAAATAIMLWKAPRTPAGFAISLAVVYLSLFALTKQAFCNYYFFCIGALCCAIAAADSSHLKRRA